jgi:hypothetical protein
MYILCQKNFSSVTLKFYTDFQSCQAQELHAIYICTNCFERSPYNQISGTQ